MALLVCPADPQRFALCCNQVFSQDFFQHGIGSLSEKAQHAILKNYYSPNPADQEINIGSFVADIATANGITEIQTRGFYKTRKKLAFFLQNYPVRIVYPVAAKKWIVWIDPQTGEAVSRNRSPKKAVYDIFRELYSVLDLLWPQNFSLTLALLSCEEYRLLDGVDSSRKKRAQRLELKPAELIGEVQLRAPCDLLQFLPEDLPSPFTAKDLQRLLKLNPRTISYFISVMRQLGLIEQVGLAGRAYLYRVLPLQSGIGAV